MIKILFYLDACAVILTSIFGTEEILLLHTVHHTIHTIVLGVENLRRVLQVLLMGVDDLNSLYSESGLRREDHAGLVWSHLLEGDPLMRKGLILQMGVRHSLVYAVLRLRLDKSRLSILVYLEDLSSLRRSLCLQLLWVWH